MRVQVPNELIVRSDKLTALALRQSNIETVVDADAILGSNSEGPGHEPWVCGEHLRRRRENIGEKDRALRP
jgi:hypothetical protein